MTGDRLAALDPRTRLLAAAGLILAVAALERPETLAAFAAAAFALTLAAGWRPARLARRLAHVEAFVLALVLLLPLTVPGRPLAAVGPLTASAEGLALAATVGARILACVLIALALLAAAPPERLAQGLAGLGAPRRLTALLTLAVRQVGLLRDEIARLREAMRARGFRGGVSRHALRSYGFLFGMTLLRAADRSARVSEAMRLRGWSGAPPVAPPAPFGRADAAFAAGAALAATAALAADRLG